MIDSSSQAVTVRGWFAVMPAIAVACALTSIVLIASIVFFSYKPDFQGYINAIAVLPGLILSLAVSQLILSRRRPRVVTMTEIVLISLLGAMVVVIVCLSFVSGGFIFGMYLLPVLIGLPVALTIVTAVSNVRFRQQVERARRVRPDLLDEL